MREKIFNVVTKYIVIENFDSSVLATMTDGLSGSDIRLVLREAVLEALDANRTVLTQEDLFDAIKSFEDRIGLRTLVPE